MGKKMLKPCRRGFNQAPGPATWRNGGTWRTVIRTAGNTTDCDRATPPVGSIYVGKLKRNLLRSLLRIVSRADNHLSTWKENLNDLKLLLSLDQLL